MNPSNKKYKPVCFRNGIRNSEIVSTIDSETVTTIIISTIEGSLMMTKLYNDTIYLNRSIGFLKDYLSKFETRERN
ncbi:TetR family transcriptional regulator C-terminal domain-containing protein [Bacillus sp. sid0103]|uniref:TetR family transcriptional regulator C-terminal domain-containing protein n=1 Tax=Bacillus sp. sid0103 TaxID=2856337 RepID=UPI0035AD7C90